MKTYQLALLQSKVYRRQRSFTSRFLKEHGLTTLEWTLLGYISEESKGGIKISSIAEAFVVEISHMTNTLNSLADKGLIKRTAHKEDQRIRLIQITNKGSLLVNKVEHKLTENLKSWFEDLDSEALRNYVEVLLYIAEKNRQK